MVLHAAFMMPHSHTGTQALKTALPPSLGMFVQGRLKSGRRHWMGMAMDP